MKKTISLVLCILCAMPIRPVMAETPAISVSAKSAILMEADTGRILYAQNEHEAMPPASVTKIMTMLLIMEAIENGQITFDTVVTASENAKRMGGSTIYLDTGEQMTVYDLLKGIAVASGNDACVAMAEHLAGSEGEFVRLMNERAAALGMTNTHFINCNGLDADGHVTTAYDIALMSRALLSHEKIFEFTTIWTDSLRDGKFGLANTNKLIRFYPGANGLKTGSTNGALYCLSATAKRDGMQLIAVVMGAPSTQVRFDSARALLDFGFASYALLRAADPETPVYITRVEKGIRGDVSLRYAHPYTVLLEKSKQGKVETEILATECLSAPVKAGDPAGKVVFRIGEEILGEVPLVAAENIPKKSFGNILASLLRCWCRA